MFGYSSQLRGATQGKANSAWSTAYGSTFGTMVSASFSLPRREKRTLYSMLNSPLPCVAPRNWLEYPNISFSATSATAVNSSSRTSLSMIVPGAH